MIYIINYNINYIPTTTSYLLSYFLVDIFFFDEHP